MAEAAYRRLTTPRGMLRGGEAEGEYGLDLTELIGSVDKKNAAATLPGQISSELSKDERIDGLEVTVTETMDGPGIVLQIRVEAETADGEFTLTLLASDVTVELIGIET